MKKFNVGLQLYSVRDDMAKDFEGTLKKVAEMGYEYVEFAGYFGKSAKEIKEILDRYGLKCISVHQGPAPFFDNGYEIIDYLKELGIEYCVIPWYERKNLEYGTPVWDETIEKFKKYSEAIKSRGMKMLYHNHDFEFDKIDGKCIIDHLYETLGPDIVNPQFDTCWVRYAGFNPGEYIDKYADRVDVIHLKDFSCKHLAGGPAYALIDGDGNEIKTQNKEDNEFKLVPLGMGRNDFKEILEAAERANAHTVIVEQDTSVDRPPLEAAEISRKYLKDTFGI